MRRLIEWALLVASLGRAREVAAQPSPSDRTQLVYSNSSGISACPDEATLRASVTARLGYDPFQSGAGDQLVVEIARTSKGLRGEVRLVGALRPETRGRIFEAPMDQCIELGKILALAMSIAIDSVRTDVPAVTERSAGEPPGSATPVGVAREPATPPDERERHGRDVRLVPRVGAGVIASSGLLPKMGPGGFLAVGLEHGWLSLTAEGRLDTAQARAYGGGEVEISATSLMLVPCAHIRWWAFCGVLTGGALRGSGSGYDVTYRATSPFWEAGARVAIGYPITKAIEIAALTEAQLVIQRTTFTVDGMAVWRLRPVTYAVAGAVYLHFR
jgi:hypothetical protein